MRDLMRADLAAARRHCGDDWKRVAYPQVFAVWMHRCAHALRSSGRSKRALLVHMLSQTLTGADIDPSAQIGPGFYIDHTHGVVIGPARIGRDVRLHGANTIGYGRGGLFPTIGDRVYIHAKASVFGGVTVGDDADVGAHSLVIDDVPAGAVVYGVPAKVRSMREDTGAPSSVR